MWWFPVVVSLPSFQLFGGIRKGHEPVLVQAFRLEAAVGGYFAHVIRWLSWPREVEHDPALVGLEIHAARRELAAQIDLDRPRVAESPPLN